MKTIILLLLAFGCATGFGQSQAMQQLEMDIQKLAALKSMLSEMSQGYNTLAKGYDDIKNISQGNFDLHKAFLDGLLKVSPVVRQYKKAADIVTMQLQLVQEYKTNHSKFTASGLLNAGETTYLGNVYSNLLNESLKNLDELATILTDGTLRMSDAERIKSIDKINEDMADKLSFLKHFNNSTSLLLLQRTKDHNDVTTLQTLYGIK